MQPRAEATSGKGTGRIAGLDGVRGLAVVAVVLFHLWPGIAPGGFLGVSLFFTLSGYLITTLLLAELETTGTISLRAFWGRRIRRLLPASVVVLFAVLTIWTVTGWLTDAIRRDVLWSALDVANWRHVVTEDAYGVSPESSPVLHFWSLSIEEQCYLVLPLIVILCCRARIRLGVALIGLLALSGAATWSSSGDRVVTYFSTASRAGELLAGALVAVAFRTRSSAATTGRWMPRVAGGVGAGGLLVFVVLVTRSSLDTSAYSHGGLLAVGALSALTIAGVVHSPPLSTRLDWRPLMWLGSVSYGLYLVHWPVLVGLRRAGVGGEVAPWLTLAIAVPLAWASAQYVELPIRRGRLAARRPALTAIGALAVLAVALVAVRPAPPPGVVDFEEAGQLAEQRLAEVRAAGGSVVQGPPRTEEPQVEQPGNVQPTVGQPVAELPAAEQPVAGQAEPRATAPPPVRYGWFGDSKALPLVLGIPADERAVPVTWVTQMGCPLGRSGSVRSRATGSAVWTTDEKGCDWTTSIPASMPDDGLDVALVDFGTWDVAERKVAGLGDGWTSIGDPSYERWLAGEMQTMTDLLVKSGARVVAWMTVVAQPAHESADRFDRYNQLVRDLATANPDTVRVIDFAGWIGATGEASRLLPDGAHATFSPGGGTAAEIAQRFLFDELVRVSEVD